MLAQQARKGHPIMADPARLDDLFFARTGMDPARVDSIVGDALAGADDGELYLEYRQSESFALDDGKLKSASFDTAQGSGCAPSPERPRATATPPN